MKEACQHLQGGGSGEERRKGAARELQRGAGCERQCRVGMQGRCGCGGRECGEHMMP